MMRHKKAKNSKKENLILEKQKNRKKKAFYNNVQKWDVNKRKPEFPSSWWRPGWLTNAARFQFIPICLESSSVLSSSQLNKFEKK